MQELEGNDLHTDRKMNERETKKANLLADTISINCGFKTNDSEVHSVNEIMEKTEATGADIFRMLSQGLIKGTIRFGVTYIKGSSLDDIKKKLKIRLFKCPECGARYKGKKRDMGGRCIVPNCKGILEEVEG